MTTTFKGLVVHAHRKGVLSFGIWHRIVGGDGVLCQTKYTRASLRSEGCTNLGQSDFIESRQLLIQDETDKGVKRAFSQEVFHAGEAIRRVFTE